MCYVLKFWLQTDISKGGPILKILAFLEVFFPKEYENAKAGMNFQCLKSVATLVFKEKFCQKNFEFLSNSLRNVSTCHRRHACKKTNFAYCQNTSVHSEMMKKCYLHFEKTSQVVRGHGEGKWCLYWKKNKLFVIMDVIKTFLNKNILVK